MISRMELKIDLIGQAVLLLLYILLLVLKQPLWENAAWSLVLLLVWQTVSAAFYWRSYRYRERGPAFWMLLAVLVLIFVIEFSLLSSILLGLPVLAYLVVTFRDTLRVYRRPRSFWDLG